METVYLTTAIGRAAGGGKKPPADPEKVFDLEQILADRNPGLLRKLPPGVLAAARLLVHERLVNAALTAGSGLSAAAFCDYVLRRLSITVRVENEHYLRRSTRPVVCANHPAGAVEGVALISAVLRVYGTCRVPANDLLQLVRPLAPLIVPVNRSRPSRHDLMALIEAFEGDHPILMFPAGTTARVYGGRLREYAWHPTFVTRARRSRREILPVWVSGRNSWWFYLIHRIRRVLRIGFNFEMALLVDELVRRRGETVTLRFAAPRRAKENDRTGVGSGHAADRRQAAALRREVEALAHKSGGTL